jgi:glyoxylase-like metal-dependent hydrolase (beta-lactamase superfamily II)
MEAGRLTLVDDGEQIVPGIRMHSAPGHNRGMMIVRAESRGQTFCFLSDMVPSAAHLQPTWVPAFDLFPLESIETRIRWLNRAVEENWLCGFGHDHEIGFTKVVYDSKVQFSTAPRTAL